MNLESVQKKCGIVLILLLAFVFEFWKLGVHDANEYDEARFAANAFEMMHNGDFINLHFQGAPDAWVARPPLKAWLIILGYKIFGYNEWGLRFSSGVFILVFFFFAFKWLELFLGKSRAFLGCLMLLSVKGIIGFHVGRNGDMDAELIAFMAGFLYFFSKYLYFEDKKAIYVSAIFLSLAFWLKTMAAFFYLPGIFLYLIFSKRLFGLLRDRYFWKAAGIFISFVGLWLLIVGLWGARYENTKYAGDNAVETMLIYDTWMRFTASHFDGHPVLPSYDFFFTNLDSRFNIWNYLFYIGLGLFFYLSWKKKTPIQYSNLLAFAAWAILPIAILLTFGMHKLDWYSAPLFLLLTVFSIFTVDSIYGKLPAFKWAVFLCLAFALSRNFYQLNAEADSKNQLSFFRKNNGLFKKQDTLWVVGDVAQNVYTGMLWSGKKVEISPSIEDFTSQKGRVGIGWEDYFKGREGFLVLDKYDDENSQQHIRLVQSK